MPYYYFSPCQIAEIAMRVEEAGAAFYSEMAVLADNAEHKRTGTAFRILAETEIEHRDLFKAIAEDVKQSNGGQEYSVDICKQMETALDRIQSHAFDKTGLHPSSITLKEALEIAINTEKESIRVYMEIYNAFVERFHKILARIIDEEKEHMKMLINVQSEFRRANRAYES